MPHAWRLLISLAAVAQQGGGWWLTGNSSNRTKASEPRHQDVSGSRVDRRPCHVVPPDLPGLTCRDSGLCMVLDCCQLHRLDALRQLLARRQDGVPAHLQTLALLVLCMGAHYLWALCWPALSLFCAVVMGLIWMLRATDAEFLGPGTGRIPETADLRPFKKTGAADKWVLVRREGHVAVFKAGAESQTIRTPGLYVPVGGHHEGRPGNRGCMPRL